MIRIFFELLPLFQDQVGADRLSDMIATLIIDDIKAYTKRINETLKIESKHYKNYSFSGPFLTNPFKHDALFLVPVDILHKLPVAESWEDIDVVVSQNLIIRSEINSEVATTWKDYSSNERKNYLLRELFCNPYAFSRVIKGYRAERLSSFDPQCDFEYYFAQLWQNIEDLNIDYAVNHKKIDSYAAAKDIINFFKSWVEKNKGWYVILNADSKKREKIVQRIMYGQALSYIETNNLDISCEPDEGMGPTDFKVSIGNDKTIIEVKLSTNNQYLHGYQSQIKEYGKAERSSKLIYVLVDIGNPIKVRKIQQLHKELCDNGNNPPTLIIIDSNKRKSASLV